jgi:hypothetical protein
MLGAWRTRPQEQQMDFLKNMQQKDWLVAVVAFLAGAIIF